MEGLFRTNSAYFGPFRSGHFLDRVSVTEMDPASYPTLPMSSPGKSLTSLLSKGAFTGICSQLPPSPWEITKLL
jgi:hypothetical protein